MILGEELIGFNPNIDESKYTIVDANTDYKLVMCHSVEDKKESGRVKKCRGTIFDSYGNVILETYPRTEEYIENEFDCVNIEDDSKSDMVYYESHEGCLIRMFHYDDQWFICTHGKLNAFESKWSSYKSFGLMFREALDYLDHNSSEFHDFLKCSDDRDIINRFESKLNTNRQYMFLLRNSDENRIVCDSPSHPTVYHVGTLVKGKLNFVDELYVPKPKKLKFRCKTELIDYVSNVNYREIQGVIGFDINGCVIKIYNKIYMDYFNIRGNRMNIVYRYLELRHDRDHVDKLLRLYPEYAIVCENLEFYIEGQIRYIYRSYVDRYIRKQYVIVPKFHYKVLRKCHEWFLDNRAKSNFVRITISKVRDIFFSIPINEIFKFVNSMPR